MITALSQSTRYESIWQFFTITVIFLVVLVIAYYTTKMIAKMQKNNTYNKNIEVIEVYKITASKYIQIVRIGEKYLVIAIAKDTVTMLTEISEEQLEIVSMEENNSKQNFGEVLNKIKDLKQKTESKK